MDKIVLKAVRREVIGKQVKALRREGKLPAVVYGYGLDATPIVLDARDASRILAGVGPSTLVYVNIDGKEHAALVRERQFEVLLRELLHVDFQAVSLKESVRASVNVILGDEEAPVVKDHGALLILGQETVEIECLPQDLPERIMVDVSVLKEVGDSITVGDLTVPEGVTILDDPEGMVVVATYPEAAPAEGEEEEDEFGAEPERIARDRDDDFED